MTMLRRDPPYGGEPPRTNEGDTPLARLRALSALLRPGSVLRGPSVAGECPTLLAGDLRALLDDRDRLRAMVEGCVRERFGAAERFEEGDDRRVWLRSKGTEALRILDWIDRGYRSGHALPWPRKEGDDE